MWFERTASYMALPRTPQHCVSCIASPCAVDPSPWHPPTTHLVALRPQAGTKQPEGHSSAQHSACRSNEEGHQGACCRAPKPAEGRKCAGGECWAACPPRLQLRRPARRGAQALRALPRRSFETCMGRPTQA